ncbi:MAG: hypothetical protein KAR19_07725 [Bacteroidales bacterium]|nr:hypothetical protein [Bacteroidales bacterium]
MKEFTYNIFGLSIRSQLEIPEFTEYPSETTQVTVRFGSVADHLDTVISTGVLFESGKEEFLLKLPNIGKYLIRNGTQIIIEPKPGATPEEIRLFLLGSVLGTILHQRGFLPLHGSTVDVKGKALVIIGNSAAGKSTLAASLNLAGYPLISDDLSAISLNDSGACVAHRGIPFIKLWKDTSGLLYPGGKYNRVRPQINKYKIPVNKDKQMNEVWRIETIVRLTSRNNHEFQVHTISGANKLAMLREHVYRDQLIKGMGIMESHFHMLSLLAGQIRLFHVERPSLPLNVYGLRDLIITQVLEH